MSIWVYQDRVRNTRPIIEAISLAECLFCKTRMTELLSVYKRFKQDRRSLYSYVSGEIKACSTCGWWTAHKDERIRNRRDGTRYCGYMQRAGSSLYGEMAVLRQLKLADISTPLEQIRSFLCAKYERRNELHPRLFEETVASVFRDFGYRTSVTAYTGDGGIDVILRGPREEEIGVQVKRHRKAITIEQIRAFTGALLLGGYTRGIFVSTSRFQSGANRVVGLAALRGIKIELLDAERFYDSLKIAQHEILSSKERLAEIVFAEIKKARSLRLLKEKADPPRMSRTSDSPGWFHNRSARLRLT